MFSVLRTATFVIVPSLLFLACVPPQPAPAAPAAPAPAAPSAAPAPAALAPAAPPSAPAPSAPAPSAPMAPALERLRYMAGTWKCLGNDNTTADFAAEFAMDGRWLKTHFRQQGGMNSWIESFMTWMPDKKQIVLVGVDSTGGYIVEPFIETENGGITSPGGIFYPNEGKPSGWKDEIVKTSDTEMRWIAHMQTETGWQLAWDYRCVKQS